MALGTDGITNTAASAGRFIPELWSDDIIAAYKQNLVVGNLVSKINHKGKRGDTIHIPAPTRGTASSMSANNQVTLVNPTTNEITVTINKWFEYSTMIADLEAIQALPSMRRHFTDAAGYALSRKIDQDLHILGASAQGGTIAAATDLYEAAVIGGDGSTTFSGATDSGNSTALTDAALRKMIQTLDDADVPFSQRYLIIPPVEKNSLMGLSRFTEQAFVGEMGAGNVIRNGKLGDVYGVEIFVSSNCPWIHINSVTNTQSVDFSSSIPTGTAYEDAFGLTVNWDASSPTQTTHRAGLLLHKDAFVFAEQQSIRAQTQYKQEYLSTLFTSDTIYGTAELRNDACVTFVVPS